MAKLSIDTYLGDDKLVDLLGGGGKEELNYIRL